jgi:serine/threonine protein kinase
LKIISQVCEGLYYAHTLKDSNGVPLGLIHRDVTPENLLVSFTGNVKITDFGIARARGRSTSTTSGTLKGKFPYMSYEMVKGMEIDSRSDIFSLGIVMWEMLTYRRLFKRDTEVASINAILNEEIPSPKKYFKNLPDGVEKIVMKALERDREKRFQTAREMGNAIEDFISQKRVIVRISDLSDYLISLFPDRRIIGDSKKLSSSKLQRLAEIKEHKSASNSLPVVTIQKKNPASESETVVLPPPPLNNIPEVEKVGSNVENIVKQQEEVVSFSKVKPLSEIMEEIKSDEAESEIKANEKESAEKEVTKESEVENVEASKTTEITKKSSSNKFLFFGVLISLILFVGVLFFVFKSGEKEGSIAVEPKLSKEEVKREKVEPERVEPPKEKVEQIQNNEKREEKVIEAIKEIEVVKKKEQKIASVEKPKTVEKKKDVEKTEVKAEESPKEEIKTTSIEPKKGFISIDSEPWTEVYLEGKKIGETPLIKYELNAGSYNLLLKNSEFGFEKPLKVNVNPNENSVNKLKFGKGFLSIETNVPAEVRLGGNVLGKTPLSNLDMYEGIYRITLFDPQQKKSKTIKVEIKEGKTTSINENL